MGDALLFGGGGSSGGIRQKKITKEAYLNLSESERNNPYVVWIITNADATDFTNVYGSEIVVKAICWESYCKLADEDKMDANTLWFISDKTEEELAILSIDTSSGSRYYNVAGTPSSTVYSKVVGVDYALNIDSTNPIANMTVTAKFNDVDNKLKVLDNSIIGQETPIQDIYDKVKESVGFASPKEEAVEVYSLYENGITAVENAAIVNCNGIIYNINDEQSTLNLYEHQYSALRSIASTPHHIDVHEASVVSFKGELHILGGRAPYLRTHYKFEDNTWKAASVLPYDFCCGRAIEYNGELHIIGGGSMYYTESENESKRANYHYKWDGEVWTKASDLPYYAKYCTVFVSGNELHILGGINVDGNGASTKHYVWNSKVWSKATDLPVGRYNSSAVTVTDNVVYIAGGKNESTKNKMTDVLLWNGSTFITLDAQVPSEGQNDCPYSMTIDNNRNPMIVGRRFFKLIDNQWDSQYSFGDFNNGTAAAWGMQIHIFYAAKHYMMDGAGDDWKVLTNNKYNAIGATSVAMADGIHLLGSESTSYADYHHLWTYDGKWKILGNLPSKLVNGTAVVLDGKLHIIGGTTMNGEVYNHYMLLDSRWVPIGKTPFDVIGTRAATVYKDKIYALGIHGNNISIICYDGQGWFEYLGLIYTIADITKFSAAIVAHRDALSIFLTNTATGVVTNKIVLLDNNGRTNPASITCEDYSLGQTGIIPTFVDYRGWISIISNETNSGNVKQYDLHVKNLKCIKVWIPKDHIFICDNSKFYPVSGGMEKIENGFKALSTGCYTIYAESYDEPYTVC